MKAEKPHYTSIKVDTELRWRLESYRVENRIPSVAKAIEKALDEAERPGSEGEAL